MMEENVLSMNQMTVVLDSAPVAVYVSAVDDRRILYTNRLARELFPEAVRPDIFCYHIAGYSEPCPFCRKEEMSASELKVREYQHPCNHRTYQISGKLIDWEGKQAHIEYIVDVTVTRQEEERHKKAEEELQNTLSSIPCGLCVYQVEGDRILPVFHNPAFYEITGYSQEHVQSVEVETKFLGVHPKDLEGLCEKIEQIIRNGGIMRHTYRLWNDCKDEYRWLCLDGTVRIDRNGRKLLYGVYSDISEQKRLELYFQNIVETLHGGISVTRIGEEGSRKLEFVSRGAAAMTHMSMEEVRELYEEGICSGIHPDDVPGVQEKLREYLEKDGGHCEFTARMRQGKEGYFWVKCTLSMLQSPDGARRIYSVYTDISKTVEENEQLHRQYEELLLQHYRTPGPDELILGHCNVTQNKILEIWDSTDSELLKIFGDSREAFFSGIADLIVDQAEKKVFLDTYLNGPALAAFARKDTEQIQNCFIRLPGETNGRYVRFKVNLVETPDTGDITGILTVTDITDQTISDRILHQLSVTTHDYIVDLNLAEDSFKVLSYNKNTHGAPEARGRHSERVAFMTDAVVLPRDAERYAKALDPEEMRRRLEKENAYTVTYSMMDENKEIRTKNMTIFAIDLRLERVCLVCTDITESVREQQGMLNVIAYTFDLAGFIHLGSRQLTMYNRKMVLDNLPPYKVEDYDKAMVQFLDYYREEENFDEVKAQFKIETMLHRLSEKPAGYDFVFAHCSKEGTRYKQINVLWGDQNHSTICLVRADVTEILVSERKAKKALEEALAAAKEASRAKSDFLSTMSHDIRTPMNAIMGMTMLGLAHLDDRERVEGCLRKISAASRHLLSLINDVLDMSRIESSKIAITKRKLSLPKLIRQLTAIMEPQMQDAGLQFTVCKKETIDEYFYGDSLRINQILINLLSNAVKFTPEGGQVDFLVEETAPTGDGERIRYRFTVRDTGIGMTEKFLLQIFEPFARDGSVSRIEGTGLGLSITKGLVDLMEGEISVESQVGKGSVFRVELEFDKVKDWKGDCLDSGGEGSPGFFREKPLTGRRFLIAEDHPINAELLSELLAMGGADSDIEIDGLLAVQAFGKSKPGTYDAILMDVQMPNMTGYEATRVIRKLDRPDAKTIPIVAMTANAFAEDIQESREAGMNAHVAKPIDVDVLKDVLTRVLD